MSFFLPFPQIPGRTDIRYSSPHPFFQGEPLILAHRGASGYAPDHTFPALRLALEQGADAIEADVHLTRDGQVVLHHGGDVSESTEAEGPVGSFSLEELRGLDAGYRWSPDGGRTYPFRGRGERILTLAEALTRFPSARFNLEIKERRAAKPVRREIERASATDRVLLAGWYSWRRKPAARGYAGPTSVALDEMLAFMMLHWLRLDSLWAPGVDAFQIPEHHHGLRVVTPRLIRRAHRHGIRVHIWTVDDPDDMRRLLDWGADGLVTNRPDVAARVRSRWRERRGGPERP